MNYNFKNEWMNPSEKDHVLEHIYLTKKINLNKSIYRYISVDRVYELLQSGAFRFTNPISWIDPFEKRFISANYELIKYDKPEVYCACFTQKSSNEAAWKMYSYYKSGIANRTAKIEFDIKRFLGCFYLVCKAYNDIKIYCSNVTYMAAQTIKKIHLQKSKYHKIAFNCFDDNSFVDLLLLKRMAFEHEAEVRIVLLRKHSQGRSDNDITMVFPKELLSDLIKSIALAPDCTDFEYELIRNKFNNLLPGVKIYKSTLYSNDQAEICIEEVK